MLPPATSPRPPRPPPPQTITPHGADVYSYADDENDMVLDPLLGQHLAHWGINMLQVGRGAGAGCWVRGMREGGGRG